MVAFISPRKSKVDIVQATGRAMRKSPGKEFGYVMVPLFLEQAANETIEEALKRTRFDDIWELLAAMREQDDVLVDIIREMRVEKGKTGGYDDSRFRERVDVVGPSLSLEEIRGAITAECTEYLSSSWDERYGELLTFKDEHGHVNVPQHWHTGLGTWVSTQRKGAFDRLLTQERRNRLDMVGFEWNTQDAQWEKMFEALVEYQSKHGHIDIPQRLSKLGQWIRTQRQKAQDGKLPINRKHRLDRIGFVWDVIDKQWEEMFSELMDYNRAHGNINVPKDWPTGLYQWMCRQRSPRQRSKLSKEQIDRLDDIGYAWEPFKKKWEDNFALLAKFKAEHGHTIVPTSLKKLDAWIKWQRMYIKENLLTAEQINRLNEIGFDWNPLETRWQEMFSELKQYCKDHGHANVPMDWPGGLGIWVQTQRKSKVAGTLSNDRLAELDGVGFVWNALEYEWMGSYAKLIEYKSTHGNFNVPDMVDPGLRVWVNRQRLLNNKGKLPPDRVRLLNDIGLTWSVHKSSWELHMSQLQEFKRVNGHVDISGPGDLSAWLRMQRTLRKGGKLSPDRINQLDQLGFDWGPLETQWEKKYKELLDYARVNGHAKVPASSTGLGRWVISQRRGKIDGTISPDRKSRLDAIGFDWGKDD